MRQGAVRSFFAVLIGWAALSVGSAHAAVFEAVRSFDPTPESFTRFGCDDYNLGGTISNCWAELGRSGTIFLPSFDAELGDLERVGVQLTLERDVALDFSCGATCNDARSDFNLEFDLYLDHPTILPDGDPLFSLRDSRSLQIPCTVSCMHSYDFDKFAWALFAEDLDRFSTETTEFFRFDWDANDNGTSRAGGPPISLQNSGFAEVRVLYEYTPVPEPGTGMLLASGLLGLAARRRSRAPVLMSGSRR